jgi:hypothetical protein
MLSRCYFNRFCSITLNDRESKYFQPKLEIYSLYRALRTSYLYLIGVWNLVIEVNTRYIKRMLSNPDISPSASINQWIVTILTFHFDLFTYLVPTMDPMDSQEDTGKMEIKKTEMMKKTLRIGLTNFMDSCTRLMSLTLTSHQAPIPFPFLFPISQLPPRQQISVRRTLALSAQPTLT